MFLTAGPDGRLSSSVEGAKANNCEADSAEVCSGGIGGHSN